MLDKIEKFTCGKVALESVGRVSMFDIDDIWGALCGEGSLKFDLCYRDEELLDGLEWSNRPNDACIIRLLYDVVNSYAQAIDFKDVVTDKMIYNPCGNASALEYQHECLYVLTRELCDNIRNAKDVLKNWRSVEIEGESSEGPIVLYFKI